MGIDEGGAGLEDRRAGVVEQPLIGGVEPGDLAVLGRDEGVAQVLEAFLA